MQSAGDELAAAVWSASGRAEVREAVGGIYARLAGEVAERRPVCVASGKCCRFEAYGHRLYVTTMELAAFVGSADVEALRGAMRGWDGTGCPFQLQRLCGVHGIRPFGCRVFFCDPTAEGWQNERYEAFHAEMKRLHEVMGVPYYYVEWRAGLGAVLG